MIPSRQPGESGAGRQEWEAAFLNCLRATGNVSEAARAAITAGQWDAAASEALDSRWARQTGRRANEIAVMLRRG